VEVINPWNIIDINVEWINGFKNGGQKWWDEAQEMINYKRL